jgi:hypothetical protein
MFCTESERTHPTTVTAAQTTLRYKTMCISPVQHPPPFLAILRQHHSSTTTGSIPSPGKPYSLGSPVQNLFPTCESYRTTRTVWYHNSQHLPALETHVALVGDVLGVVLGAQLAQVVAGGALLVVERRHVRGPAEW